MREVKSKKAKGKIRTRLGLAVLRRCPDFNFLLFTFYFCIFTFALLLSPSAVSAQRDYLTNEEVELVRDSQEIDRRIDVLMHAIDRRFSVLNINVSGPKIPSKEVEKWGEQPQGTRLQLLFDIKRILQKAIDDIDSLAERPDSLVVDPDAAKDKKKPRGYADLFPIAVRSLAKAAERYRPALKTELDKSTDNVEKGSILDALDFCNQITEAVAKLPAETQKKKGQNPER